MAQIRVTKEFDFEMAHALWNYDGPCRNIHGHSYKLEVTVKGKPSEDTSSTKLGMVIDFSDLKKIVKSEVVQVFDHSVVISRRAGDKEIQTVSQMFENFHVMDYQPSCENLLFDMVQRIQNKLPGTLTLVRVKLRETATSYAEWLASDNP